MGGIVELLVIMVIVATAAFAPLGYFIYKYTQKNGEPFGDTEPHGDSHSFVNDLAETAIHFVKSVLSKKK
jgi:hypothetical protein